MLYTWVHGLHWNDVKDAPSFAEAWSSLLDFMQGADHLAAHNAGFDRRVLQACCAAAGLTLSGLPFLCTLKGSRRILRLPSHKLSDVCAHFNITLSHHHAGSDARAAAEILLRLRAMGLSDELMRLQ
jgi:DNA polymerase-3 subunit epsilon